MDCPQWLENDTVARQVFPCFPITNSTNMENKAAASMWCPPDSYSVKIELKIRHSNLQILERVCNID